MHERLIVGVSSVVLLLPVAGLAMCWRSFLRRPYASRRRRISAASGLAVGSFAVVFAALLPLLAMLPVHGGEIAVALAGAGMAAAMTACPLAIALLAFGLGRERWLGIGCVLLALLADLLMLVGTQG